MILKRWLKKCLKMLISLRCPVVASMVSGGEALMQMDSVGELFQLVKGREIFIP